MGPIVLEQPEQFEDIQIPASTASMPRGNRGRNGDDDDDDDDDDYDDDDRMKGIISGHLEIFLNLREKVNNLSHILWNLKNIW